MCKDTYKRTRNIKLARIFFAMSASIFEIYLKDTYKRTRNIKSQRVNVEKMLVFSILSEALKTIKTDEQSSHLRH